MTDSPHVVFMVLAHRRPWLLPLIVEQLTTEFKAVVQITLDRPSADVVKVVSELERNPKVEVFAAPEPCLTGRDNFMAVRRFQFEQAKRHTPNYAAIHDDDHILQRPGEARFWMAKRYDLIYVHKRFIWDRIDRWNEKMPPHRAVYLFKVLEDDQFPETESGRIIHAPVGVHDREDSRSIDMCSYLLDIGYLWPEERERVFKQYAKAGRIDSATTPLVQPPVLRSLTTNEKAAYWQKRLEKELKCLDRAKTR